MSVGPKDSAVHNSPVWFSLVILVVVSWHKRKSEEIRNKPGKFGKEAHSVRVLELSQGSSPSDDSFSKCLLLAI